MSKLLADRWQVRIDVTTNQDDLLQSEIPVYNYSSISSKSLPTTKPSPLLFEKRVKEQELNIEDRDETPYLFSNRDSFLGFDPLAAAFYLISRYEEYLPHRTDDHDRFISTSSILCELDCLQRPLVDIYLEKLRLGINAAYPNLFLKKGEFKMELTIDVDRLFLYESKGIAKSLLGGAKDLFLNRKSLSKRMDVGLGGSKDPLDIYGNIQDMFTDIDVSPRFFFQVGESSRFDHNNPVHLPMVRNMIHQISLKSNIGLHPSYFTSEDQEQLIKEHDRLKRITNQEVKHSRQHYLRYSLPTTYRWLENIGVTDEYSMGFSDANGFRAGTSYPFRFYDLGREEALGLTVHPFVFMDLWTVRNSDSIESSLDEIKNLMEIISSIGGVFGGIWHPEALVGFDVKTPTMPMLEYCVQKASSENR